MPDLQHKDGSEGADQIRTGVSVHSTDLRNSNPHGCHFVDERDRPLCGGQATGGLPGHSEEQCLAARHKRCRACDSLQKLVDLAWELTS